MKRPIGSFIYCRIEKYLDKRKIRERMRKVHVVSDEELTNICRDYYIRLISNSLMVFVGMTILSIGSAVYFSQRQSRIVLTRESYGGDEAETRLETEIDGRIKEFSVDILPLSYDAESVKDAFDKGFEYIDSVYLGGNESADSVSEDLNLIDTIDELGLKVSWDTEREDLVDHKGKIIEKKLDQPQLVNMTAMLSYEDFEASRVYAVKIVGKEKDKSEEAIEQIQRTLTEMQIQSNDSTNLVLPEKIAGYPLMQKGKMKGSILLFVLGAILSVLLGCREYSDICKAEKKRNDELLRAYPSFVDLMVLYMGAGLTVKGSLGRVVLQSDSHILTEELNYTLNEIQSGIPETEGYYRLSGRLGLPVYQKIFALLSQNIKKGTRDILNLLTEEEMNALQLKRELAKRKGEEAGTKLLFPMILQLGIVMFIVIAPALLGF